jgi:hypothetical protein
VLVETGFQPGVFETLEAILAHDHPRVVEFLVIVSIINFAVVVEIGGLPERGASSTCQVSKTLEGFHPLEIAFALILYKLGFATPVCSLIFSGSILSSKRVRAWIRAPIV